MNPEDILWIVIHCSATSPDMNWTAEDIRLEHLRRGFDDIGYHYVVCRDGTRETGRPEWMPGAHAYGYNRNSLGICLSGGVDERTKKKAQNNFTVFQFDELRFNLLPELTERYPAAEIVGHRDLPGVKKACPSFDVIEWWDRVRQS